MAVDEKEDFKGRRKRDVKNEHDVESKTSQNWTQSFPVNVTVDELYLYRKKKQDFGWLKDNLQIEEGSFKHLKTEYKRRFKNFYEIFQSSINGNEKDLFDVEVFKPEASLKLEGTQTHQSEYDESFNRPLLQKPSCGIMNDISDNEISNRSHPFGNPLDEGKSGSERHLLRRPTNLKIEGDFSHITEYAEEFIEYLLVKRAELCRTPTTLKLGTGEMESKTETTDQFRKFDNAERRSLIRTFTNLHLEGELGIKNGKQERYPQYEVQARPPLIKKSTNLHLEGDYSHIPEYSYQYIQYKNAERPGLILPSHNLKSAGLFENSRNEVSTFGRSSPLIPFLRESYSYHDFEEDKKYKRKNSSSRYQSNTSLNRTSSHPNLVKSAVVDEKSVKRTFKPKSPQTNAYLDFDANQSLGFERKRSRRESSLSVVPGDSRSSRLGHDHQSDGRLFLQPEYKSALTEFPRERPRSRRPEGNFANEGEVNYLTEKRDRFIQHKEIEKKQPLRKQSEDLFDDPFDQEPDLEQSFDGRFECQPEYRKALIDYLIREKPPHGQRRRILEIPDITIDSDHNADKVSSPNDNTEKDKPTSPKEERPKSSVQKPPSSSSSVPSSPKTTATSTKGSSRPSSKEGTKNQRRPLKLDTETLRLSPTKKKRVFRRSSTPSPVPQDKPGRTTRESSPNLSSSPSKSSGNWKSHLKPSSSVDNIWNSTETDPAFFIVNDRVPSRSIIRHNLYKEQKWMPSWYSSGL